MSNFLSGTPPMGGMTDAGMIMTNFVKMSICFSLNHGAVTAMLALAVPLLGKSAGPISTGTLYIAYALTALLLSAPIMGCLGTRKGLIVGCWVYCGYVASFPLALTVDTKNDPNNPVATIVAVAGGVIGGFAAGFLWNAQGAYFTASTKLYAAAKGIDQSKATGKFAAIFATIFLSLEVVLKLLASAIKLLNGTAHHGGGGHHTGGGGGTGTGPHTGGGTHGGVTNGSMSGGGNGTDGSSKAGNTVVSIVYSIIAVVASIIMVMVWDLEKKVPANEMSLSSEEAQDAGKGAPKKAGGVLAKVLAAMKLWCDRPTVMLLNLIQVAFGVSATLLYIQVSGTVVQARFGKTDSVTVVGFMAATTALVAALCQVPFAKMSSTRLGKPPFMILSLSAFVVLGALVAALPTATLGQWPILVLLYVLQGIGRAGYEGANKAIYADFFPDDSIAAFGNVILFNGLAGSASSYIFGASSGGVPLLSTTAQSLISCVCGGLAIAGYVLAEVIHRRQKSNTAGYSQTE